MSENITTNRNFTKNFEDWGNLKPKLDESDHKPPFAKEGEVWWCNCGENIGSEICGKGKKFLRPFAIIKKLSKTSFVGIPVSSRTKNSNGKLKIGTWFYHYTMNGTESVAHINQIKNLDYKRLQDKLGELTSKELSEIKKQLKELLDL